MNQKLLAFAAVAAIAPATASAADVTFSGVLRGVVNFPSQEDGAGNKNDMNVDINRARLRVDVRQKLDNGMSMSGYMRIHNGGGGSGVEVNQTGVYIDGGFGSVGIQGVGDSGNFGDTLGHLDIFETGAIVETGVFQQANSSPNTLWYSSPDFGGAKLKLAILTDKNTVGSTGTDTEDPQGTSADEINPRITYGAGPLFVALGMNLVKSSSFAPAGNKEYTRTNFGAKYTLANLMFGFSYETAKEKQTNDKHTGYGASFSADFDKVSVRLAAGSKTDKSTGNPDVKGTVVAVGVDYKLGKGAKVFAEVANLGKELANSGPAASPKSSSLVQIGAVLGF